MVLIGYIDESFRDNIFSLTCLIGDSPAWFYLQVDWNNCVKKRNDALVAAGRKPISRYHAADLSNMKGEFRDWDKDRDQIPFALELLTIIEKHKFDAVGFAVDLNELSTQIPCSKNDPRSFAYAMLLRYIMDGIKDGSLKNNGEATISLIHDRSDYDAVLADTYDSAISDPDFSARRRFASITSQSWEESVPLQAADLFAYENFKEVDRQSSDRIRRKSLERILKSDNLGGFLKGFNVKALVEFQAYLESLDDVTRNAFLSAARVPIELWEHCRFGQVPVDDD